MFRRNIVPSSSTIYSDFRTPERWKVLRSVEMSGMIWTGENQSIRAPWSSDTLFSINPTTSNIHSSDNLGLIPATPIMNGQVTLPHNALQLVIISLKLQIFTCSWDPYQHQWSWFQIETVTGLQGTLWMPSSGQLVIYCNQAKSFHLESRGPEICKIWPYVMQKNMYIPMKARLSSHQKLSCQIWIPLKKKAAGSS